MNVNTFILFLLAWVQTCPVFSQTDNLYIPVTVNTPLFNGDEHMQVGVQINNYGLNYSFSGQKNNKVIFATIQHSDGDIFIDPLSLRGDFNFGRLPSLIGSYPVAMFYSELGLGYNLNLSSQKLSFYTGLGRDFVGDMSRLFVQVDWGNEGKLANIGTTLRGNYARVGSQDLITLEPMITGKIKYKSFRLLTQFGFSIAAKKGHDYMKPLLSVGLGYVN